MTTVTMAYDARVDIASLLHKSFARSPTQLSKSPFLLVEVSAEFLKYSNICTTKTTEMAAVLLVQLVRMRTLNVDKRRKWRYCLVLAMRGLNDHVDEI